MKPDDNFKIFNENIEFKLKELGDLIGSSLPEGWGFNLLLFDFIKDGKAGSTFYISNARREDMLKLLAEFVEKSTVK